MKNEISQKLKIKQILSGLTFLIGTILTIHMIKVEGEPGALPLFLISFGIIWLTINQYQVKNHLRKN